MNNLITTACFLPVSFVTLHKQTSAENTVNSYSSVNLSKYIQRLFSQRIKVEVVVKL